MYNKQDIKKLLNHCKAEGLLDKEEINEISNYFDDIEEVTIFNIEAVFDIEYQLFDLDYALGIIESS